MDELKKNQKVDFPFTLWHQNYPLLKKVNRSSTHIGDLNMSALKSVLKAFLFIFVSPFPFNYKNCRWIIGIFCSAFKITSHLYSLACN